MENSAFVAISHQMALKRQMEIIANNIANQNTTAFKSEKALFEEYLVPTIDGRQVSYVQDYGILRDTSEGTFQPSQSYTDVAISGKGYFVIDVPGGDQYTRNGRFRLNEESELITGQGHKVMDDLDRAIVLDPALGKVTISADGTISTNEGPVAKLKIVEFENPQLLRKVAAGLYSSPVKPTWNNKLPPPDEEGNVDDSNIAASRVVQYMFEASNVNPILEMTNMIYVHRAYSASQKLGQTGHELQRKVIDKLASVD